MGRSVIRDDFEVSPKCAIWTRRRCDGARPPRVLVVDDYVDTADAVGMVLAVDGFPTEVVYSGRQAIEASERWHPDIVLLDIWMPDMSGLQVAAHLRSSTGVPQPILVGHSALSAPGDLQAAKDAGFDAYCSKPTDADKLAPLLRYLCDADRNSSAPRA
ncbi:Response regulator receiver protein [Burkholderia sp. 8Y]|uniref:response regulator n=1 Tax=Burkholderia sp. 8Y TaxID=2653133 RepID=UPI0012EFC84B|nr:response regulator [Burkholderia sp. 8Y]VXC97144.1 Response regulator receiver protein [Burkholderia sp. 8Y]